MPLPPAKKRNKFSYALSVLQSNTKEFPNFPLLEFKAKMLAQIIPKIFTEMHLLSVLKEMHSLLFNRLSSCFFSVEITLSLPKPEPTRLSWVPKPKWVERVRVVLSQHVRVLLKHPRVCSESTLNLFIHVAKLWDRRDINVITVVIHHPLSLRLMSLVFNREFMHRVEPSKAGPVEIPRTQILEIELLIILKVLEGIHTWQSEETVINFRKRRVQHVVQVR